MSGDGTTVAYDDITNSTRWSSPMRRRAEPLLPFTPEREQAGWCVRALNHDGSLLLYGDQPIQVWDVAAGEQVASFDGHRGGSLFASVLTGGTDGAVDRCRRHVARVGGLRPATRSRPTPESGKAAWPPHRDGLVFVIGASATNAAPASLIDTRARGELGVVETCPGMVVADSLRVAGRLAVFNTICDGDRSGTTSVVDVQAGGLLYTLPGHQAPALGGVS